MLDHSDTHGASDRHVQPNEVDESVPAPLLMNCWKHHARVVHARITAVVADGEAAVLRLPETLLQIGTGLMDFYLGHLSIDDIAAQTVAHLDTTGLAEPAEFRRALDAAGGYATLDLSDTSRWVMRWGTVLGRHVHIHPGRYSPHSIRVPANAMKSAIATLAWARLKSADPLDLAVVNEAREKLLSLSPIKSISTDDGLGEVLSRFITATGFAVPPPFERD